MIQHPHTLHLPQCDTAYPHEGPQSPHRWTVFAMMVIHKPPQGAIGYVRPMKRWACICTAQWGRWLCGDLVAKWVGGEWQGLRRKRGKMESSCIVAMERRGGDSHRTANLQDCEYAIAIGDSEVVSLAARCWGGDNTGEQIISFPSPWLRGTSQILWDKFKRHVVYWYILECRVGLPEYL